MTLSYTAHSKNISINILLLILLCTSVFSICHTVQRKQYNQIPYHVYVWIKRKCNVYLAFSNWKAYHCGMSTQNIPSEMLLLLISLEMSPLTCKVKAFLVTYSSTLKIPVSHYLTSQATCTCSGHFTTNISPCAAYIWRREEPSDKTKYALSWMCFWNAVLCCSPHDTPAGTSLWEPYQLRGGTAAQLTTH